jgi:acyl dehydratase
MRRQGESSVTERLFHIDEGPGLIDKRIGVSPWVRLDQEHVSLFGEATRDADWAHVDPERSARESPYGGTIVQGFLMMSMLIHLHEAMGLPPAGTGFALNYGMDEVRFTDVVMTGSRVRVVVELTRFEPRGEAILMATRDNMEVEGKAKPCMVADWLVYLYPEGAKVG